MSEQDLNRFYTMKYGPFIHMAPLDKAIWIKFLHRGGTAYAPFFYDVRVGDGVDMGRNANQTEVKLAYALTTKRIDALAKKDGTTWIIEVKQRAGLGAIGQMLGYKHLYEKEHAAEAPTRMLLVTDALQPDMLGPLRENNIHVVEVGY